MAIHYRTLGIIIRKENRGEADQIFTIYTKDFGKLEILGKAIRKIKSKLRSGIELFYLSEIEFIQGKTYKTLTDAILIEKFKNLRKNLKGLAITYRISEMLDKLLKTEEPDRKIWQLLKEVFHRLNNLQLTRSTSPASKLAGGRATYNLQLIFYYFFWNFLSILGYQPELYNCLLCQRKLIPEKIYFNSKEGGVICPSCFKKIKGKETAEVNHWQEINSDIVKILRIILKRDWKLLSRLKIEPLHQKMLETLSISFLSAVPQLK